VVNLVLSFEKVHNTIRRLSKEQVELLILATSQPYLKAVLCLAWLTLCPEHKELHGPVRRVALSAKEVFSAQWRNFLEKRSDQYKGATQQLLAYIKTLKVENAAPSSYF
jgi:hypothetical protein